MRRLLASLCRVLRRRTEKRGTAQVARNNLGLHVLEAKKPCKTNGPTVFNAAALREQSCRVTAHSDPTSSIPRPTAGIEKPVYLWAHHPSPIHFCCSVTYVGFTKKHLIVGFSKRLLIIILQRACRCCAIHSSISAPMPVR